MENNNIFEFILDYLKTKKIDKKYEKFLNEYNVYNLCKKAKMYHYHFLVYYLGSRIFYENDKEIFKDLKNLKIELKKFYNHRVTKLNIFILKI